MLVTQEGWHDVLLSFYRDTWGRRVADGCACIDDGGAHARDLDRVKAGEREPEWAEVRDRYRRFALAYAICAASLRHRMAVNGCFLEAPLPDGVVVDVPAGRNEEETVPIVYDPLLEQAGAYRIADHCFDLPLPETRDSSLPRPTGRMHVTCDEWDAAHPEHVREEGDERCS